VIRLIRELLATAIVNQRIRRQERTDARVIYGEDLCDLIRKRWGAF
jgi:hypothetical protein